MEKEKGRAHSPDTVLEDYFRTLESDTLSSRTSTSEFEEEKDPKPVSKWARFVLRLLKAPSRKSFPSLHSLSGLKLSKRFSSSMREYISKGTNPSEDDNLSYFKPQWKNFTLSELQSATINFRQENLIGKGGYAEVYKGCLQDGRLVAIKRLIIRGPPDERTGDFLSELGIMAHVNHPNTARLIGYGLEGGMYLVLELSQHGSLASLLHCSSYKLEWKIRHRIAVGTAEGLLYLHEGCQRRIIHRDIKAANILLTAEFEPQICDFGLAKWLPEKWTHHTVSKFEGTFGYLAPEYLMHGIVDEKTDVFAFGVLLLELITGRRALDYSQQSLVLWAKPLMKKNRTRELVDPLLGENYNKLQLNLIILVATLCVQQSSIRRPRMSQVVQLLKGDRGSLELVKKCRKPSSWKRYYEDLFSREEYQLTREGELNVNNEQKQLALLV